MRRRRSLPSMRQRKAQLLMPRGVTRNARPAQRVSDISSRPDAGGFTDRRNAAVSCLCTSGLQISRPRASLGTHGGHRMPGRRTVPTSSVGHRTLINRQFEWCNSVPRRSTRFPPCEHASQPRAGASWMPPFAGMTIPMMRQTALALAVLFAIFTHDSAYAAPVLDGTALRWPWALPFIGILLTIATGPLLFPRLWHHHYGKLAFIWSALTLAPLAALHGAPTAFAAFVHAMLAEYLSFIVLLFALYVVAGGILVTGNLRGTPLVNTAILTFGTMIASVVGTTGAAMILVRPLIRANAARLNNVHVIVFFIFLVANIGGALSPLGDPPLFVRFLHGIDFFWTMQHLWFETVLVAGLVLLIFIVLDVWYYRKDRLITTVGEARPPVNLGVSGVINLP